MTTNTNNVRFVYLRGTAEYNFKDKGAIAYTQDGYYSMSFVAPEEPHFEKKGCWPRLLARLEHKPRQIKCANNERITCLIEEWYKAWHHTSMGGATPDQYQKVY